MTRILVTGSNGFLGSMVVRKLLQSGEEQIRCFNRPGSDTARLDALRETDQGGRMEPFVGTLNSPEDCARAIQEVDVVYHLAAALSGAPSEMFLSSVVATKNLLNALVNAGTVSRLIHISSFGVYGMTKVPAGTVVDESSPLEQDPRRRDLYSHTKLRQEQLIWQYHRQHGIPVVVLRPGVVYGPDGPALSSRVGVDLFGLFLYLGRDNLLPLSYVENCADAIVTAGRQEGLIGEVINVHDDDLRTARQYLREYRRQVKKLRVLPLPFAATKLLSAAIKWYHEHSRGQLPAIFTPYKVDAVWKSFRYDNSKLRCLGWRQEVSTAEAMRRTFLALRRNATH